MDILADLNEPQRRAVTHGDGPLLVLAGAGSGKTRVITRRVAWLIAQGARPWNVLAITFTNKAAGEMRERVEQLGTPRGSTVCTFHALCVRLLREFAAEAGLSGNFSIYDRDDQLKAVKQAVASLELSNENFPAGRVHAAISTAKNQLKTPQMAASEADGFYERNVARIYARYDELLAANNALDFDDLLFRMARLLRDRRDILAHLSDRYRYIMIDEYQDTNHAQYVIAHGIAMAHENICATGDPDQSIYAWRGADIGNILEFEQDYPNAVVIRLEENYRSVAPILAAASRLIAHNKRRKEKKLWTRREGGASVRVVTCDDEHAEAGLVARRIADHHAAGGRWDDVAVFYRVNSLSRIMEEALFRAGIPYRIARGTEFYNRKEIKDVLAYLRVLANPSDDLSLARIINTPPRGIGDTTVGRLESFAAANRTSLLAACRQAAQAGLSQAAAAKVIGFAAMIDSLAGKLDRPVRAVMEDVLDRSGMNKSLAGKEEEQKQARANVDELINTAVEFDKNFAIEAVEQSRVEDRDSQVDQVPSTGAMSSAQESAIHNPQSAIPLHEYLHQVSLVSDVDHFEGGSGAVTLMTLHAAKGLEFRAVYIIGCEMGLLPFERLDQPAFAKGSWDRAANAERLEEERRLAFVGMTRARDSLTLTCARHRMVRGRTLAQAASQFLHELGDEMVAFEDVASENTRHGGAFGPDNTEAGDLDDDDSDDPFASDRRRGRKNRLGAARPPRSTGGFYADIAQREAIEASSTEPRPGSPAEYETYGMAGPPMPGEYEHLHKGSKVHHPTFGAGRVVGISQPWPHTRVRVEFPQYGTKTLVLAAAKLEVLLPNGNGGIS
ncbi:MAG: ATP-dependent helicase [Phycisphaerae bacterium]